MVATHEMVESNRSSNGSTNLQFLDIAGLEYFIFSSMRSIFLRCLVRFVRNTMNQCFGWIFCRYFPGNLIDSEEEELEVNLAVRSLRLQDTDHLSGAGPGSGSGPLIIHTPDQLG